MRVSEIWKSRLLTLFVIAIISHSLTRQASLAFWQIRKSGSREKTFCYNFASAFEKTFGSLRCFELRPTGFSENDPPHMCENLTCKGIEFAYQYILGITQRGI